MCCCSRKKGQKGREEEKVNSCNVNCFRFRIFFRVKCLHEQRLSPRKLVDGEEKGGNNWKDENTV